MKFLKSWFSLFVLSQLIFIPSQVIAGGKLIGTSGGTQIEGSGGGGLVPWATLSGYGTRDEKSVTTFFSAVSVDDFRMTSYGASYTYHDRIEVSFAHQSFKSGDKKTDLSQDIIGLKVRLFGDLVYTPWPQVALGAQFKNANNTDDNQFLGAKNNQGVDYYFAATKAWLDGPFHRSFVLNTTLRYSKANQLGLRGFGGDKQSSYKSLLEASAGVFITRYWMLGVEYRQKPDLLRAAKEDDWKDIFVTFFPNKTAALSFAFVDLGRIDGKEKQSGAYLSLQLTY